MSLSEENGRGAYRPDGSAGTDEEYFALLDKRRRELSRARGTQNTKAPADRPQNGDAGSAQAPPRKAAPGSGNARSARKKEAAPPLRNEQPPRDPPSGAAEARRRAEASRAVAEKTRREAAAREASRRAAEEKARREAAAREASRRAAEEKTRREAAAREASRRAAEKKRQKDIKRRIREKKRAELAGRALAAGENLLIFFAVFLIVCAVAFSAFVIYLSRTVRAGEEDTRGFTYLVEDSGVSLEFEEVVSDGVIYVDFSGIAGLCGISVSGVRDELVFDAGGETAVFLPGSPHATVNGTQITLEGNAMLREDRLWLPLSFVRDYVNGVDVSLGEVEKRGYKYRVLSVSRTPDPEATGALDCWLEPSFRLKPGDVLSGISPYDTPDAPQVIPEPAPSYEFISDLSAYERFMSPDGTARDSFLLLVNDASRLTYRYVPAGLTEVADARTPEAGLVLCRYAEKALEALLTEARAEGFGTIAVSSAYVSYDARAAMFDSFLSAERNYSKNNYAATGKRFSDEAYAVLGTEHLTENYILKDSYTLSLADARRVVLSYCAEPGADEHQSGLCADLCDTSPAAGDFGNSEFYGWLCRSAHKFGFILRYPADKTDLTGRAAEPWHLRFVGRYHAEKMYSSGMCLEEYCEKIQSNQ